MDNDACIRCVYVCVVHGLKTKEKSEQKSQGEGVSHKYKMAERNAAKPLLKG